MKSKTLLSKVTLLLAFLAGGVGSVWADTYVKVTDANELEVDANYLIVYESGNSPKALGSISTTSTKYGLGVDVTVSDNQIEIGNQAVAVLTLGGNSNGWTFKSSINNEYLCWNSGNSLQTAATITNNSQWKFQINNDGTHKFINVNTEGRVIKWNTSSPRFACYTQGQADVSLYKKVVVVVDPTKSDAEIAWSEETANIEYNLAGEYTLPTLSNPNNLTVKYSSNNNDVASIDENTGVLTISNVNGEAVITAKFEGDDDYNEATVSYTLTVTKLIITEDGVFDFDLGTNYGSGYETGTVKEQSGTWTAGNVTLLTAGRNCWFEANDGTRQLRLYKESGDNAAGSMTISVPDGKVITKIVISGTLTSLGATSQTYADGTWTGSQQSVGFVASDRVYVNKIVVTYEDVPAATTETATVTSAGWATYVTKNAVEFREDTKAYIVELADEEIALLTPVESVPAKTPIVLEGEGEYTMDIVASSETDVKDNMLLEVGESDYIYGNTGAYVLAQKSTGTGFYLWTGDRLAVGKVYMYVPSASRQMLRIVKPGEATRVDGVVAGTEQGAGIFDLQGRRVERATKGVYIVNGKKMIVK